MGGAEDEADMLKTGHITRNLSVAQKLLYHTWNLALFVTQ